MLLQYLRQLQANGQSHVVVSPEAKEVLRDLYRGDLSLATPSEVAEIEAEPEVNRDGIALPEVGGGSASEQISALREQAADWPATKSLGSLRPTLVFSAGSPEADLMMVGEAPGYHDERKREPFAGPAGEKLTKILAAMGLSRDSVYLTNICKNRPAMPGQTTNNRNARPEEIELFLPFLRREVEIVRPKAIVALGATAAKSLLGSSEPFESLRGTWHNFEGAPLLVSHHPSYLMLADKNALPEKRKIWEEMMLVMKQLDLDISPKQKNFFLPKS